MSEPCHTMTDRKSPPPRPASVTLSPLKGTTNSTDLHPNQAVVLDEVGEGEMVENKLVIPDEMVRYLNQVADNQTGDVTAMSWSETPGSTQKPLSSPSQLLQSPSSFPILPSPQNANMLSPSSAINQLLPSPNNLNQMMPPSATNLNQMIPSPSANMNQMMPSPSANLNQIMPSPAPTMNHMMPSPASNQMMSPASNINQVMPSPNSNYQVLTSPSSNYGTMQNPMLSPAQNMNQQMVPSPAQMVPSSMTSRCHSQMMSPNTNTQVVPQNCIMTQSGQMIMQNAQMMIANGQIMTGNCYNRQTSHNNCYGNWDNRAMCQNVNMVQNEHHNMCNRTQNNYNDQCRPQMSVNNSYMSSVPNMSSQCSSHSYQVCGPNSYINNCQNKMMNNYNCNTYQPMQSPGYNCIPNMAEPLPSPAMATPAPSDVMSQPQQAQMSRPCTHYTQNCYPTPPYTNQCVPNSSACTNCGNCRKPGYNKGYNQCRNNEIQCKDISQSQMSPGITSTTGQSNVNSTTMLGMRQDAYQRTLEYVQNCQSWVTNPDMVSSSTHPLSKCGEKGSTNMVVNDMTSSLSSLLEENRYLQMIQ